MRKLLGGVLGLFALLCLSFAYTQLVRAEDYPVTVRR